jgi:hypothetical protein
MMVESAGENASMTRTRNLAPEAWVAAIPLRMSETSRFAARFDLLELHQG